MKIGVLIDQLSSWYCWQRMGHHDHDYIIYRDQLNQNSSQTTLAHHHNIMKAWLDYLVDQWVKYIICPPMVELHFQWQYPQIAPIFTQYLTHALQHSIVGKIWFIGTPVQCQSINLHWWDIISNYSPWERENGATEGVLLNKQLNNRHFNPNFPLRTSTDIHLPHRLVDHKPDHYICNSLTKKLLRPLKDAAVDTVIWLDWSYYACDVSRAHHCRSIKRHHSNVIQQFFSPLVKEGSGEVYSISIYHTGTLRDLQQNKKLRWMLARGQNHEITQIRID
jgi:hypothetical protein